MLLGRRLKELRKEKGLTQEDLGNLVNVTKVSICCYENGTRTPSLETLIDLSNIFEVNVDYLLGHDKLLVAENEDGYSIKISTEEIVMLNELRKSKELYRLLINDPKRTIELLEKKVR